ncbi:HIRAN domain-containing protein [Streptococcus minor]|uniref:HIRAN domain-containing protein n=1 Tax=Streptococcus minor TaxID=229549 RepID=UPI000370D605|nr:HIRAN domain-containing protein [Streptococcus minor]
MKKDYANNQRILTQKYSVAGTSYRLENIHQLIKKIYQEEFGAEPYNGFSTKEIREYVEFGDKLYRYGGFWTSDVVLIPEPANKNDSNAIKVIAKDIFVGYIPKDKTGEIHKILANSDLELRSSIWVVGGPYKYFDFSKYRVIENTDLKVGLQLNVHVYDKTIPPEQEKNEFQTLGVQKTDTTGDLIAPVIGCLLGAIFIGIPLFILFSIIGSIFG